MYDSEHQTYYIVVFLGGVAILTYWVNQFMIVN